MAAKGLTFVIDASLCCLLSAAASDSITLYLIGPKVVTNSPIMPTLGPSAWLTRQKAESSVRTDRRLHDLRGTYRRAD
jgi:hypothetical protein